MNDVSLLLPPRGLGTQTHAPGFVLSPRFAGSKSIAVQLRRLFDKAGIARIAFMRRSDSHRTMNLPLINEHFFNPKNVGNIAEAQAVARAGSLTCGATLRVSLCVDESQRITDAKFKSAGCSYLVAASSLLTEQVKGKTTAEAAVLGRSPKKSIIEQLGGWPVDRDHCAALACEALISAVKQYSESVREEWSGDEALICTCFGVSERTIERDIQAGGLRTIAEVTKASNAGAGCRSCYSLIQDILDHCSGEGRIMAL